MLVRLIKRIVRERDGFSTVAMMGVMIVATAFSVAALEAADGDVLGSHDDSDRKRAYAAAEAGVNDYQFHVQQDDGYWARCTGVPSPDGVNPAPVNDRWDGSGTDPRTWRRMPDSTAEYTIELLPANGRTACDPNDAEATMLENGSGTFRIRSTGRVGKVKRSIVATFRRQSFLDYLYFTDLEDGDPSLFGGSNTTCRRYYRDNRPGCTEIRFVTGDAINGPLHTNDELLICGTPAFGRNVSDQIEMSAPSPGWRGDGCSGDQPTFVGTPVASAPILTLPPSNTQLSTIVQANYRFTGRTHIVLNGTSMNVWNTARGLNGASMAFPSNGVVYVANGNCTQGYDRNDPYGAPSTCGDVFVTGTYSAGLTIAAEKDVIVGGTPGATNGDVRRSGDAMLGLIANNFIRVYHPTDDCDNDTGTNQNVRIDAAILSLLHSFLVDSWFCGQKLGTLTVDGAIAQKHRGPVGTGGGSGTGYLKNYIYDDRLKHRSPPFFLDPVAASWRLNRTGEQVPPR